MTNKTDLRTNDTKERIIQEAQKLYHAGGYEHMSLERIAKTLDIKRPAVYYHFPGGKEELFIEMVNCIRDEKQREWLAVLEDGMDIRTRLMLVLENLTKPPRMNIKRLIYVEFPEMSDTVKNLFWKNFMEMQANMSKVFSEAVSRGELRSMEPNVLFFSFLSLCQMCEQMMESEDYFPQFGQLIEGDRKTQFNKMLDIWLYGVANTPSEPK